MTTPSWPALLNHYAEKGSFKSSITDETLRSSFDKGPSRVRRRFTTSMMQLEFTISMSDYDLEVFKSFYFYQLSGGINWFILPMWTGTEYVKHKARFIEPYSQSDSAHGLTSVSFKLECRQMPVLPEYVVFILGTYGIIITEYIQIAVNVDYPEIVDYSIEPIGVPDEDISLVLVDYGLVLPEAMQKIVNTEYAQITNS